MYIYKICIQIYCGISYIISIVLALCNKMKYNLNNILFAILFLYNQINIIFLLNTKKSYSFYLSYS